jgi:hypothetical protein
MVVAVRILGDSGYLKVERGDSSLCPKASARLPGTTWPTGGQGIEA